MLARGAADDKGQVHAHVMAAAALLATRGRLPINVKYVFEGEEESSSVHLDAWLSAEPRPSGRRRRDHQRHRLLRGQPAGHHPQPARPDVRSDRRRGDRRRPPFRWVRRRGRRTRRTRSPRSSRRSRGRTDGSASPASTTTSCRSPRPTARRSPLFPSTTRRTAGTSGCRRSSARSATRRSNGAAARPTLDVNGMWGGFPGEGSKTIIPAHAHAKVSCRLVAAQDPDRIFEALRAYVEEIAPPGVTTTVTLARRRTPEPHPDGSSGDPGGGPGARGDVRPRAGLHPRGWLDPGVRQLRLDPRPAGRPARVRASPTTTPTHPTSGWTCATTRRASGPSPGCGTSWSTCPVDRRSTDAPCAEKVGPGG